MEKIRLGVSACLLGEPVRYDGGHRLDRFVKDTLGAYVEYVPVCPEVECGMPIPRESMRLEGDPEAPRLVTTRTRQDLTDRMLSWVDKRLDELEKEDLCGFIFKSNSPSSGMERVKIYDANGVPRKIASGVFAGAFMKRFPLLPVEDEGRLCDAGLRENFIERIFVMKRWRETVAKSRDVASLVDFHTEHKLLVLSHNPKRAGAMGKLVAAAAGTSPEELRSSYLTLLMEALRLKTTPGKNTNTLQHIMGYFKRLLSADEKEELLETIERYRLGYVPLIVPVTLLNHFVRKFEQPYLKRQYYLNPHPIELKLRNHV